jgi:ribonuclease HI
MDVVVAEIPPKFGMLLSRSWDAKLKGSLQIDMSYAIVPVSRKDIRLYREVLLKYMVISKDKPNKHPIYAVDTDIGSTIFYNDLCLEEDDQNDPKYHQAESIFEYNINEYEGIWNMDFDGAVNKEGGGVSVYNIPPDASSNSKLYSYKLAFGCTNNMVEYESLILGMNTLKYLGAKRISVHGDSELVINHVKGIYQTKHPRMRAYRNLVLDFLENISEYNISVVPRGQNPIADVLATSPSVFNIPIYPNKKYEIEVKHRQAIPDNVKY